MDKQDVRPRMVKMSHILKRLFPNIDAASQIMAREQMEKSDREQLKVTVFLFGVKEQR